jgi:hypothetical protein
VRCAAALQCLMQTRPAGALLTLFWYQFECGVRLVLQQQPHSLSMAVSGRIRERRSIVCGTIRVCPRIEQLPHTLQVSSTASELQGSCVSSSPGIGACPCLCKQFCDRALIATSSRSTQRIALGGEVMSRCSTKINQPNICLTHEHTVQRKHSLASAI